MAITIEDGDLEAIKKNLFRYAMQGNWDEVVNIYKQQPRVHKAEIIISGETALHMAVSEGKEDAAEELVKSICHPVVEALEVKNERGNTPLHFAASIGNVRICKCIAGKDPKLVGARNNENETPLFLAALHGKKDAFLCLHEICDENKRYENGRRGDGKTILHFAIFGEFFDLAFQIIHLYERFVNYYDEEGFTPLHLLASRPTAFRSGTHLSWISNIIYQCFIIEKLEKNLNYQHVQGTSEGQKKPWYPENYETCINFWNILKTVLVPGRKCDCCPADTENPEESQLDGQQSRKGAQLLQLFPPNYDICFELIKLAYKAILVILGLGFDNIQKMKDKKERHTRARQIMDELLQRASMYEYDRTGRDPRRTRHQKDEEGRFNGREKETTPAESVPPSDADGNVDENKEGIASVKPKRAQDGNKEIAAHESSSEMNQNENKTGDKDKIETPILIAAKNGVKEMVEKILKLFPVAIYDRDSKRKNAVLLAAENRQPDVYKILHEKAVMKDIVFSAVDDEGNSALHLAAMLRDTRPWHIPGYALQMHWEIKWYKYVKKSMPRHFFPHLNNERKTAKEIFSEKHSELVREGGKWLNDTSNSCSLVATLIATVAFASMANVPGSFDDKNGLPLLEHEVAFTVFAISAFVALCFSVTSLIMFLAILTSTYQERNFHKDLLKKLMIGLTALFISIGAILICFCASHFLVLKDKLKHFAGPIYALASLPISFFVMAQFPLYLDLLRATYREVPQRSYKLDL